MDIFPKNNVDTTVIIKPYMYCIICTVSYIVHTLRMVVSGVIMLEYFLIEQISCIFPKNFNRQPYYVTADATLHADQAMQMVMGYLSLL